MQGPGQTNNYQQQRQTLIRDNYWSVYERLLPDEGQNPPVKQPIEIGNKDVYALSDIEGYNIDFLDFLNKLGLVEYTTDRSKAPAGWKSCKSLKKGCGCECYFPVYYEFKKDACRTFKDVIVLCGDYVRNARDVSIGTVEILEELDKLLNLKDFIDKGIDEQNKGLFLVAGNHDIADYDPNVEWSQQNLKTRVLDLGLYPQLLLKNGDGERLLFQHTNFPYLANNNFIVNKKINPQKAEKILKSLYNYDMKMPVIPMLDHNGFFCLRYIVKQGDLTPNYYEINAVSEDKPTTLPRELYSDFGIGYDAKFIGHDGDFHGCSMRPDDKGDVYNVNICNRNEPHFVCWRSNKKHQSQPNVQPNHMRSNYDAIQNKDDKKNLYNLYRYQYHQKKNQLNH